MFDFQSMTQFADGKPVAAGFDAPAYASWNAFRAADESRYITGTEIIVDGGMSAMMPGAGA